jgi:hypothetical protein
MKGHDLLGPVIRDNNVKKSHIRVHIHIHLWHHLRQRTGTYKQPTYIQSSYERRHKRR